MMAPPLVQGLPLLGNALALRGDITAFMMTGYRRYGSVFRMRVLRKEYVILGGIDANRLLSREGNTLFTGKGFFGGFAQQFDTDSFLPAMEGQPHNHLRKILRPGYSKEAVAPRLMLRSRRYQTARAKTREFLMQLIDLHLEQSQGGDLVDIALAARNLEGDAYTDDDLVIMGIGAYVAGMDTLANTLSFMLYALLKHPDVLQQVRAEADQLFAKGTPKLGDLRGMTALHGAAVETLRLYMIAPVTLRTALTDFEFGG